jgi:regulation of enolase protein 1 (concanavalin A-like superfamily)
MVELTAVPFPLSWAVPPVAFRDDGGSVTVEAGARTDMFVDPGGGDPVVTAPRLLGPAPAGDFRFSARVRVGFTETYDAGVLLLWAGERHWAKLCFERSPQGRPMAVSVVTRGVSDDANGFTVDGDTLWLRISRLGGAWAFHASTDGERWEFVRYFSLDSPTVGNDAPVQIGLEAQSPVGAGCSVTFSHLTWIPERLADLRDGG